MTWHAKRTSKLQWRDLKASATSPLCALTVLAAAASSELAATTSENVGIAAKLCHHSDRDQGVLRRPCDAVGNAPTTGVARTLMASLMIAR